MSREIKEIKSKDGYALSLRIYEAQGAKAVVKCIHGMEEHQDRYEPFAEFLQKNGYTVVTADLRGHGRNAPLLSHIADKDGHLRLMEDEECILSFIRENYPGLPVVLFGHSMGTIVARAFLQRHSQSYAKVVLSGYPNPQGVAGVGAALTDVIGLFRGKKGYSSLVDNMVLGGFAKAVPDAESPLDWLSYNRDNRDRYAEDPLCGVRFTLGSYNTLFHLVSQINRPDLYQEVKADLPILLISGVDDPCTGGEQGRKDSVDRLEKAGFTRITRIDLEHMRHEILNEEDREQVYGKILDFLNGEASSQNA